MKISKIDITDYNQFKNLRLDLTYPKGHLQSGQALDKICFLGQSGTGKTSLLTICKAILRATVKSNHDGTLGGTINTADQKYHLKNIKMTSYFKDIKTVIEVKEGGDIVWHLNSLKAEVPVNFIEDFYADKNLLIYFHATFSTEHNRYDYSG